MPFRPVTLCTSSDPRRSIAAATVVAAALALAACGGAAAKEQSGVKRVDAKIDGLTCELCVPPLTASLKQQFGEQATIEVDDETDTATVRLAKGQKFDLKPFMAAAKQVRMRVMAFHLEVCGRVSAQGQERWLSASDARFLVAGGDSLPLDQPLCIEGDLDASKEPLTLIVSSSQRQDGRADER